MRRWLIVGATSAIAEATMREFALRGDALYLVGRSAARLQAIAEDLSIRGAARTGIFMLDVRDIAAYPEMLAQAASALQGLDGALVAHGTLTDQAVAEKNPDTLLDEFLINATSVMALCSLLATHFAAQGRGVIAVISSVAGERGRQSNYVYGAAKAAVTAYTSGLRQRLAKRGVQVVTIKPGFVDTPMTAAFKKSAAWATPAKVGRQIAQAMMRGTPVLYTPGFWRPVMWVIRSIPEFVFKRLSL